MPTLGYLPALDGLRGVAILCVVLYHVRLLKNGFLGVDIFFVLSGFLITLLLIQEGSAGRINLRWFYWRRALRLMPALVVYVAICGIVAVFYLPWATVTKQMLAALTYTTNIVRLSGGTGSTYFGHTWSLSIEEQFYLLWPPLVAVACHYRRLGAAVGVAVGGSLAAIGLRQYLWEGLHSAARLYFALDTRLDAILLGALAAFTLGRLRPSRWYGVVALLASLWILLCVTLVDWNLATLYLKASVFINLGVVAIVLGVLLAPSGIVATALSTPPLVWLGRLSYSLYLWHFAVIFGFLPTAPTAWQITVSVAFAAASFAFVERPMLRLKQKFASGSLTGANTYFPASLQSRFQRRRRATTVN
jgi:peptidoglycan/LPS O-acetylase OafA/YrhL